MENNRKQVDNHHKQVAVYHQQADDHRKQVALYYNQADGYHKNLAVHHKHADSHQKQVALYQQQADGDHDQSEEEILTDILREMDEEAQFENVMNQFKLDRQVSVRRRC